MPLKFDENKILENFQEIGGRNASKEILINFLEENFKFPGKEFKNGEDFVPIDFTENLSEKVLDKISDEKFKNYANEVHKMWLIMSKELDENYDEAFGSLLEVEYPVVLAGVPRFRETYYWDSYWIVKGLLVGLGFWNG